MDRLALTLGLICVAIIPNGGCAIVTGRAVSQVEGLNWRVEMLLGENEKSFNTWGERWYRLGDSG
jgi:hypothetical protein